MNRPLVAAKLLKELPEPAAWSFERLGVKREELEGAGAQPVPSPSAP